MKSLLLILCLSCSAFAENVDLPVTKGDVSDNIYAILHKNVTVNYSELSIVEFGERFRKDSGLNIIIEAGLIKRQKRDVTLKVNEMGVEKVLQFVEKITGVDIRIVDGAVFIK